MYIDSSEDTEIAIKDLTYVATEEEIPKKE